LLEDTLDLPSDARGSVPVQRILVEEDSLHPGDLVDPRLVLRTPVVSGVAIDAEVLENHSIFRQVEIGIPDPNLAPVDHGQRVLVPIGDSFPVEYTGNPNFSPAPVPTPLAGLTLMMMPFCHAKSRVAFLI
jgi:hypothetical protein